LRNGFSLARQSSRPSTPRRDSSTSRFSGSPAETGRDGPRERGERGIDRRERREREKREREERERERRERERREREKRDDSRTSRFSGSPIYIVWIQYIYIYIYIYMYRERERESYVYMYTFTLQWKPCRP
jgi:hypothetical protein